MPENILGMRSEDKSARRMGKGPHDQEVAPLAGPVPAGNADRNVEQDPAVVTIVPMDEYLIDGHGLPSLAGACSWFFVAKPPWLLLQ